MTELEDDVEIADGVRAFALDVLIDDVAGENEHKREMNAGKHRHKHEGMGNDAGEEGKVPSCEPEQKIFYAPSVHQAQLWFAAISDAIDEDALLPKNESALVVWLKSVATQLHDMQGRTAEQAREMLSCNVAGLSRIVTDSRPPGANCMPLSWAALLHPRA